MKKKPITILCLILLATSCGKVEDIYEEKNQDVAIAESVEIAITAFAGAADEESDSTISFNKKSKFKDIINFLNPIQTAHAAICSGRAQRETCLDGVKSKTYSGCSIGLTAQTFSGIVELTYSDTANCDITAESDSLTRTFDYTRTTALGAKIRVFSTTHTDFEGNTYGGGGKLTKVPAGYELDILGKHKTRTGFAGKERLDISIRTTAPISFNKLARNERVVDGGAIVVAHNLANYKVTLEPSALAYTSSCCYPTSGTITATYDGVIDGSGVVTFNGCGEATVSRDGVDHSITFNSCE